MESGSLKPIYVSEELAPLYLHCYWTLVFVYQPIPRYGRWSETASKGPTTISHV